MNRYLLSFQVVVLLALLFSATVCAAYMPEEKEFTNSIAMKFVRIEPGTFKMGQSGLLPFEVLPHTGGRGELVVRL
jgi:formylglycine-generating enzyme required for sulfatase activity